MSDENCTCHHSSPSVCPHLPHRLPVEPPEFVDIVFDGPPGPESGRFVEAEQNGRSVSIGEWIERPDGLWALRIPMPRSRGAIPAVSDENGSIA